jgi:hypothetical protein
MTALIKINIVPQEIGRVILILVKQLHFTRLMKRQNLKSNLPVENVLRTRRFYKHLAGKCPPGRSGRTGKSKNIRQGQRQRNTRQDPRTDLSAFFTTKPAGQGTGLGLSLAYDIVKAHGGELKVETKENEGAEFIIYLT